MVDYIVTAVYQYYEISRLAFTTYHQFNAGSLKRIAMDGVDLMSRSKFKSWYILVMCKYAMCMHMVTT